ncbi:uncharacterized protein J3D65DRAFT_478985 [Phyllosticta citribraziliensis]|uniref:Uncharacterized protein n=1 Tax=Phyllosticta citribraziliensis TaxID=989973 RepID=A0ABR1LGB6_9PEZI
MIVGSFCSGWLLNHPLFPMRYVGSDDTACFSPRDYVGRLALSFLTEQGPVWPLASRLSATGPGSFPKRSFKLSTQAHAAEKKLTGRENGRLASRLAEVDFSLDLQVKHMFRDEVSPTNLPNRRHELWGLTSHGRPEKPSHSKTANQASANGGLVSHVPVPFFATPSCFLRSRRTETKHRRTPFQLAHWTPTHDRPWDPQSSRDQGTTRQGWTSREPWKSALSHGRFPWPQSGIRFARRSVAAAGAVADGWTCGCCGGSGRVEGRLWVLWGLPRRPSERRERCW